MNTFKTDQSEWWQWCRWHRYIGDFMMVTDLRCWWQNHYVGDFLNVFNQSPTSQTCHQHIWFSTSVTNIDVTLHWAFFTRAADQFLNSSVRTFLPVWQTYQWKSAVFTVFVRFCRIEMTLSRILNDFIEIIYQLEKDFKFNEVDRTLLSN